MQVSSHDTVPGGGPFARPVGGSGAAVRVGAAGSRAVLAGSLAALLLAAGTACAASVVVTVDGIVPGQNRVFVSLCASGLGPSDCQGGQVAMAVATAMTFTFTTVDPGTYAVAAFQDFNGNGLLDRSTHGLPLEPYGFSNNAGRSAVPRFEKAAVQVERDTVVAVHLGSVAGRR